MNTEETHPHPADHQPQQVRVITFYEDGDSCNVVVAPDVTVQQFAAWWWNDEGEEVTFDGSDLYGDRVIVTTTDDDGSTWERVCYCVAVTMTILTAEDIAK